MIIITKILSLGTSYHLRTGADCNKNHTTKSPHQNSFKKPQLCPGFILLNNKREEKPCQIDREWPYQLKIVSDTLQIWHQILISIHNFNSQKK